jgi:hypothetical protein
MATRNEIALQLLPAIIATQARLMNNPAITDKVIAEAAARWAFLYADKFIMVEGEK